MAVQLAESDVNTTAVTTTAWAWGVWDRESSSDWVGTGTPRFSIQQVSTQAKWWKSFLSVPKGTKNLWIGQEDAESLGSIRLGSRTLGFSTQEAGTQTIDYKAVYETIKAAYHYSISRSWVREWWEQEKQEQAILFAVASAFRKVEKVHAIYFQKYQEELQFQILLSIAHYDGDLMDTLLDIEYRSRKRHAERVFAFSYLPVGIVEKKDVVHPAAQCIYAR